jgi:NTE family protein
MTLRALLYRACFAGSQACRLLVGLLGLCLTCSALAQSNDAFANDRPRVALVLSGGGARGLAHVGVLQVLEEMRVPVDCVVGTSMGALVGATYAAGVGPKQMREVLQGTDIGALFVDAPPRSQIPQRVKEYDYKPLFDITLGFNGGKVQLPYGASAGYKVELFLRELVGPGASVADTDFDDLPTPYRAVATDLGSGEMKVFEHGDLPLVMRASMSLPAVLAPITIDGRAYVDGGLVRNLPVDVGRSVCGDVVIAVNLGTPLKRLEELQSVIGVAGQSINLLTEQNVQRSLVELTDADILIEPDLAGFSSSDFTAGKQIVERGLEAAQEQAQALSRLSVDEAAFARWLAERESRRLPEPRIVRIQISPSKELGSEAIRRDIDVEVGEDFSYEELHDDLERIYGRGDFSYLGYSVVGGSEAATILVDAEAKPWGPGYLKFGFDTRTDFDSPTQGNLAASYRRTWINSLSAEWRVDAQIGYDSLIATEFLQPLQVRDGAFVAPYVGARRSFLQFYDQELRLGQLRINSVGGGLDFGLTGTIGEVRLGPFAQEVRTNPDFGVLTPFLPVEEQSQIGLRLVGIVDRLDSVTFARKGWLTALDVEATDGDWGSDDEFGVARLLAHGVKSFGKNTFSVRVEWGEDISGDLPANKFFELGGPARLSGLFLDQLTGTRYNLGTISYYRQYATMPTQIGRGVYAGFSVEAGRINDPFMKDPWDWVTAGSLFLAADTILGTFYIGYGHTSLGQGTAYLSIGQRL